MTVEINTDRKRKQLLNFSLVKRSTSVTSREEMNADDIWDYTTRQDISFGDCLIYLLL